EWELVAASYPPRPDPFRAEWERAARESAGDADAEYRAKRDLARQRLSALLAEWTAEAVRPPAAPVRRRRIVWEGSQAGTHSYGVVNRALCAALARRGHDVV